MKICHVSSVRTSDDLCMFQREAVLAAEAGYDVSIVAKGESRTVRGISVVGVGDAPASRLARMLVFTRRIFRAARRENAGLYLIHDPELLPLALRLKRAGKKVVFDSHELYAVLLRSKDYLPCASLVAALYARFERYAVRRLDAVILPAPVAGKDPFSGVSRRTVFAANYASLRELYAAYRPRPLAQPQKLCFVGHLTPDRGAETMIDAAAKAGVRLLLVGDFTPEDYGARICALPSWANVDFRGVLDRDAVADVCREATIAMCLMPNGGQYNIADTFNMKVYDYMAMGLPVILSDSAYARAVNAVYPFAVLVNPGDSAAVAAAVRALADDPMRARQMGEAGRRAIAEKFNWERESQKLLALYADLIGPTKP